MFKVKKIEEKISLDDLKVNDEDICKQEWINAGSYSGDNYRVDCGRDCVDRHGRHYPYKIKEY